MKLDAIKQEELVGAMRDTTLALLRSRWSEERRAASFDLRTAVMALKKAGSTKEAWRQALIINKMLLDPETEDAVDDVAYTVKLGGLLALSTLAISLGQAEISKEPSLFLDPLLFFCKSKPTAAPSSFHAKVRYHAGEALFNVIKTIRIGIMLHLDEILITLSDLAAASDLNIKMAAVMVDKMLKEVVLETDEELTMLDIPSLVPLLLETLESPLTPKEKVPKVKVSKKMRRVSASPLASPTSSTNPTSSSSTPPSSSTPSTTSCFDWGNDTYCVQFLLLSWLDLVVPQSTNSPPPTSVLNFIENQGQSTTRHPHLSPVLPDLVYVLSRVIIDDKDVESTESKNREISLRPSQMANNLLKRLVSVLS